MARKRTIPVTVNLTPRQKAWIDLQVDMGYFPSVEDSIKRSMARPRITSFGTPEELGLAALEGLESGPGRELTDRDREVLRRRVEERAGA